MNQSWFETINVSNHRKCRFINYWHPVTNSCSSSPTQWPRRSPVRNIAEEKHVLHTCQINIPIAKKIINQKFIWVAHLRNNYFVTHIVLLIIHDTMQYFKTNDIYLRRFLSVYDLDVSNPIIFGNRVIAFEAMAGYSKRSFKICSQSILQCLFCENFHPILIIILVISVGVNLGI